jgi:thioredoxin reductase
MMKPDVCILGGGPAGLSAALWLKNLGFAPCIIEAAGRPGGMQNLNFLPNEWVLGHVGLTGPQLVDRFVAHVEEVGVRLLRGLRPVRIDGAIGAFRLRLADDKGTEHVETCAALVLATGTRYRAAEVLADVPGFADLPTDCLRYGPYAFDALAACAAQRVLIVGGGDNAFENARLLIEAGASVDLVLRSPPRAQRYLRSLVEQAEAAGACRIHRGAGLARLECGPAGIGATIVSAICTATPTVDRIHVLAGYEPNLGVLDALPDELRAALQRDADGYLSVDARLRTGVAGIYAAGDICNPAFPSVVSAIAQGAQAAKTIELDLRNL